MKFSTKLSILLVFIHFNLITKKSQIIMGACVGKAPRNYDSHSQRDPDMSRINKSKSKSHESINLAGVSIIDKSRGITLNKKIRQIRQKLKQLDLPPGVHGEMKIDWFQIDDKFCYKGEWKDDKIHGKGQAYINEKGQERLVMALFVQGKVVNSKARIIDAEGGYYEGSINSQLEATGSGIYINQQKGIRIEGLFYNNYPHGKCTEIGPNYQFIGDYQMGKKIHGTMKQQKGVYEGDFSQNMKEGHGKYKWNEGGTYIGQFSFNQKHGKGKLYDSDNQLVRKGQWFHDQMSSMNKQN